MLVKIMKKCISSTKYLCINDVITIISILSLFNKYLFGISVVLQFLQNLYIKTTTMLKTVVYQIHSSNSLAR